MNDADPRDPVVNGDEARNIKFDGGGFDASQVNDLLARNATELDAGRPTGPLIANATLKKRPFVRGYDPEAVIWFLEQLRCREDPAEADRMKANPWRDLAADPYFIRREPGGLARRIVAPSSQECAYAWRNFPRVPGTRLSWVRTGARRNELRSADQRAVAAPQTRQVYILRRAAPAIPGRPRDPRTPRTRAPGIPSSVHGWLRRLHADTG